MSTAATSNFGSLVLVGSPAIKVTSIQESILLDLPSQCCINQGVVLYLKTGITGSYLQGSTFDILSGPTTHANSIDSFGATGVTLFGSVATSVQIGQTTIATQLRPSLLSIPNRIQVICRANTQSNVTGDGTSYVIRYANVTRNIGGGFNTVNGAFTAQFAGNYLVSYTVNTTGNTTTNDLWETFMVDSVLSTISNFEFLPDFGTLVSITNPTLLFMTAGQSWDTRVRVSGGASKNVSVSDGVLQVIFLG